MMRSLAGENCPRVFVDVGANDGFYGSNSFPFVARGWRSLLIEPHPVAFEKLRQRHQGKPHVTCLNLACSDAPGELPLWFASNDPGGSRATLSSDEIMRSRRLPDNAHTVVQVERLDMVLAGQGVPSEFGILSIDAEGMDYEVLLGLDLKQWRPRVIVTEDYASRNELKAKYLEDHGYQLGGQCSENAMWIRPANELRE